ncbi:MAG: ORF6N domain-containing protein [Pseudomonadota bacterium]
MSNITQIAPKTQHINIGDTDLPIIEYKGQRVITFAMMEQAHKRPSGTARKRFNDNRERFVEGEDFYELTASEIRTQSLTHIFPPRTPKGIIITETGYLMLVKSFTDDLAWQVQRELVNKYFATPHTLPQNRLDAEITLAKAAADMLRMSNDSRLKMLHRIGEGHKLSTAFLPDYTEDKPTQALATLLKEHGVGLSAIKVNKILIELGILEIKTRNSTKTESKSKEFKCLTETGLKYGKNLVNHNNPCEVQPHYYCDTFLELLDKINGYLAGDTVMEGAVEA